MKSLRFLLPLLLATTTLTQAFVLSPSRTTVGRATTALFALPNPMLMRVSEIKEELESYGVSTKSFFEKKEMVEALNEARAEGKTASSSSSGKGFSNNKSSKANGDSASSSSSGGSSSSSSSGGGGSRDERIKEEMDKASKRKVGELKKELEDRGISTKSFFEKSEFVKVYAEAVVDGVQKKAGGGGGSRRRGAPQQEEEQEFDSTYRDVEMQKFDARDPRLMRSKIIDVRLGQ